MSKNTITGSTIRINYNRGNFLGAKIYSDVRDNKCECGGKFSARSVFKGLEFPICNKCKSDPPRYRVVAKIVDANGVRQDATLRHDQNGNRLCESIDVLYCLKIIQDEISNGVFDANKYKSKNKRDSYRFENFAKDYLDMNEKRLARNEMTIGGFKYKRGCVKHLVNHFKDIDISYFRNLHVENFRENFEGTNARMNQCLSELKTMLNYAHKKEKITHVPYIGEVKKSKKRTEIMEYEIGLEILSHVEGKKYVDLITIISEYPVRPGEVRALRWNDINFKDGTIKFDEHFSDEKPEDGRKSRRLGQKHSVLILPMTNTARKIFLEMPRPLNSDEYVFKGDVGKFVSATTMNKKWREARDRAKIKPTEEKKYHLYEFKHGILSDLLMKVGGNLKTLENASGVDIKTLMERYTYSNDDLKKYFQ